MKFTAGSLRPQTILGLALLLHLRSVAAAVRSYNLTIHSDTRSPDGVSREVYLINGQLPAPLITADEGDELEIFVQNDLSVEQAIHWHGLLQHGTPQMDGVPGVTQFPIPAGGNFTYRFSTAGEYGFYWYHSHLRAYYNDAIRGPLLINPAPSRTRPFASLSQNSTELAVMLQAEKEAIPIVLSDWYHRTSDVILSEYLETGAFPQCVDSLLANGLGRVQCLPQYILDAGSGLGYTTMVANDPSDPQSPSTQATTGTHTSSGMVMSASTAPTAATMNTGMSMSMSMSMPGDNMKRTASKESLSTSTAMASMSSSTADMSNMQGMPLGPKGCSPQVMFKQGYNSNSIPPETCSNTTSPLYTFSANDTLGWVALHLVNAGAVTRLSVSLDSHVMIVYSADGLYVEPQEVNVIHMSIGQRYSVLVRLDQMMGTYALRFSSYPYGDMQQVIEGQAMMVYQSAGDTNTTNNQPQMSSSPDTTWALTNGSAKLDSLKLNETNLAPYESIPPPPGPANVTLRFNINQTDVTTWVIGSSPFAEPSRPIIYGSASDAWNSSTTIHLPANATIDILMTIASDSMDTMGHPMHLHGHKFWVLGTGQNAMSQMQEPHTLNLNNPAYRDTVDLPANGWAAIRYSTDNPGAWFFHCHVQWHLLSGMAVVLVEGEEELPALVGTIQSVNGNQTTATNGGIQAVHVGRHISAFMFLLVLVVIW